MLLSAEFVLPRHAFRNWLFDTEDFSSSVCKVSKQKRSPVAVTGTTAAVWDIESHFNIGHFFNSTVASPIPKLTRCVCPCKFFAILLNPTDLRDKEQSRENHSSCLVSASAAFSVTPHHCFPLPPCRRTRGSAAPAGRASGGTMTDVPRTPRCSTTTFRFLMVRTVTIRGSPCKARQGAPQCAFVSEPRSPRYRVRHHPTRASLSGRGNSRRCRGTKVTKLCGMLVAAPAPAAGIRRVPAQKEVA